MTLRGDVLALSEIQCRRSGKGGGVGGETIREETITGWGDFQAQAAGAAGRVNGDNANPASGKRLDLGPQRRRQWLGTSKTIKRGLVANQQTEATEN